MGQKKTSPGKTFPGSIGGYHPKNFGGEFIPYIMYVSYPKDNLAENNLTKDNLAKDKFRLKTTSLEANLFPLNKKPLLIG